MLGLFKSKTPDGFSLKPDDPLADEHRVLTEYLEELVVDDTRCFYDDLKLTDTAVGTRIAQASPESNQRIVSALAHRLRTIEPKLKHYRYGGIDTGSVVWRARQALQTLLRTLLRRKLPLASDDLVALLDWMLKSKEPPNVYWLPCSGVVNALEHFAAQQPFEPELQQRLEKFEAALSASPDRDARKLGTRLQAISGGGQQLSLVAGEAWSDAAINQLAGLPQDAHSAWVELLGHCQSASAGKPGKKWLATAETLLDKVGFDAFSANVLDWFPLVDKPRTRVIEKWSDWMPNPNLMIDDRNADALKGLAWCCGLREDADIAGSLSTLAVSAYKKVPGIGPRATRIGNACVHALGQMPGEAALSALAILKVRVKFGTAQKGINKALDAVAERAGLTRDELEELGIPAYGLDPVGIRNEVFGDVRAELIVSSAVKTELRWINAAGKPQKSVPRVVKEEYADDLKELKRAAKDIEKMLTAQRERFDNLFLSQRVWRYSQWRERYLDHPLVGTLARRLVWEFSTGARNEKGIWSDGSIVDAAGRTLDWLDEDAEVRIWHPVGADLYQTTAWRGWFEQHEVRQPFKQAHREIYLLTDAERSTAVYSNRYAAHVIKQHQFNALCTARGWRNSLRLMVDDDYPPATLELPQWNLRAEFWVEGAGEDYGVDTNEAGTYLYLLTDQVRFYHMDAATNRAHAGGGGYSSLGTERVENQPLPLTDIPPLVLSEVLRDVDLFVGVASVGNDPNWFDGGPEGRYQGYWNSYSFGELSGSAQSRRELLEKLIPRLRIRDRCELSDRFLIVRGDVRTYKIHLGSSNILMEPSDQYLCIVASQTASKGDGQVFLPFEGDNRLAVILSKAFMLADDKKIKDRTITSQIRM